MGVQRFLNSRYPVDEPADEQGGGWGQEGSGCLLKKVLDDSGSIRPATFLLQGGSGSFVINGGTRRKSN